MFDIDAASRPTLYFIWIRRHSCKLYQLRRRNCTFITLWAIIQPDLIFRASTVAIQRQGKPYKLLTNRPFQDVFFIPRIALGVKTSEHFICTGTKRLITSHRLAEREKFNGLYLAFKTDYCINLIMSM